MYISNTFTLLLLTSADAIVNATAKERRSLIDYRQSICSVEAPSSFLSPFASSALVAGAGMFLLGTTMSCLTAVALGVLNMALVAAEPIAIPTPSSISTLVSLRSVADAEEKRQDGSDWTYPGFEGTQLPPAEKKDVEGPEHWRYAIDPGFEDTQLSPAEIKTSRRVNLLGRTRALRARS